MPKIIDPVFAKTSPNRSICMTENERFGLVFVKTGSIIRALMLGNPGAKSTQHYTVKILLFNPRWINPPPETAIVESLCRVNPEPETAVL